MASPSTSRTIKISLAFVGLQVGAGFATGQEVVQYFLSAGMPGLVGALCAGIAMTLVGAVILQIGSYFLADEHMSVFRSVSHPVVARLLDVSVVATLFCIGFVMFAGAGANLHQQYGLPTWLGAGIMLLLVLATGMMDVDKVSKVISAVTPLIIVAILVAFIYTLATLPEDPAALAELASQQPQPVSPWWLASLNYDGLALLLGVSMCLVIGGNHVSPREAWLGGLIGGGVYTLMLLMSAVTVWLNFDTIQGSSVPMLELFNSMHPWLGQAMTWVIYAMIYNTCIGMFYALGKRLSAGNSGRYVPIFVGVCLAGYAVSFAGFGALMQVVYPILGYLGVGLVVVLAVWWFRSRRHIAEEADRRERLMDLETKRQDDDTDLSPAEEKEIRVISKESSVDGEQLQTAVRAELGVDEADSAGQDGSGVGAGDRRP